VYDVMNQMVNVQVWPGTGSMSAVTLDRHAFHSGWPMDARLGKFQRHANEVREIIRHSVWMFAMAVAFMGQAHAQQYVYPAKGQSPEQQKNDEAACY